MAPQTVIDYIVVHELCHFRHRDHSDAFWNEVDKILPNYRERKEWLRKNGAALDVRSEPAHIRVSSLAARCVDQFADAVKLVRSQADCTRRDCE